MLLKAGAKVNGKDQHGNSALTTALIQFQSKLPTSRERKIFRKNFVIKLLQTNADVNSINKLGNSALNIALDLEKGGDSISKLILQSGADTNHVDHCGRHPLHMAAECFSGDLVEEMITAGANVNVTDECGNTPLIKILLRPIKCFKRYASLSSGKLWSINECLKIVTKLVEYGAFVNHLTNEKKYPLLIAVEHKLVSIVEYFLQKGASVNTVGYRDEPILITALRNMDDGNTFTLRDFDPTNHQDSVQISQDIFDLLIEAGANVHGTDTLGNNLLAFSVTLNCRMSLKLHVIKVLIAKGTNVNCVNNAGDSALNVALCKSYGEVALLLVQNGADGNILGTSKQAILLTAAETFSAKLVCNLVKTGVSVNVSDTHGETALIKILKRLKANTSKSDYFPSRSLLNTKESLEVVTVLIQHGADVNHVTNKKTYPLLIAVEQNISEIVECLIKSGAHINKNDDKENPLLLTAVRNLNVDIVSCLISSGVNVNVINENGDGALHLLLKTLVGHFNDSELFRDSDDSDCTQDSQISDCSQTNAKIQMIAKLLVTNGADVNTANRERVTPLNAAVLFNNIKLVELLLQNGALVHNFEQAICQVMLYPNENRTCDNVNSLNTILRNTCTKDAIDKDVIKICPQFLPLHMSIIFEHEEIFHALLQERADIFEDDAHGNSAIHYAARTDNESFLLHLLSNYFIAAPEQTELLDTPLSKKMKRTINVNSLNIIHATPLHIAAYNNRVKNVELLIKAGCNVDIMTKGGKTALMIALKGRFDEIGEMLLKAGSNLSQITQNGESIFQLSVKNGCLRSLIFLINAGIDVQEKNSEGGTALNYCPVLEVAQILINQGVDVDQKDNLGRSPLHMAVETDNVSFAVFIIGEGADVNVATVAGETPFFVATRYRKKEMMKILYENGADINKKNNEGHSPLIHASVCISSIHSYDNAIFYEIMNYGPDWNVQDNLGNTALMHLILGKENCIYEIQFLLSIGADANIKDSNGYSAMNRLLLSDSDESEKIKFLLQRGADPVLEENKRHILNIWFIKFNIGREESFFKDIEFFRLFSCNGIIFNENELPVTPFFFSNFINTQYVSKLRYKIATCSLTLRDKQFLKVIKGDHLKRLCLFQNSRIANWPLFGRAICEPWPLVKLAFMAVSISVGFGPGRQRKIQQIPLPPKLQQMLLFQTPVAKLPVSEWNNIPLCFDPVEYEKLPNPRPLLYYWPFGRVYQ